MKTIYSIFALLLFAAACSKDNAVAVSDSSNGSLTRFITVGNYLYTVDNSSLKTYDITTPSAPVFKSATLVGFAIQTIFAYQDKLFIGSANAMFVYSISNPVQPQKLSETIYFVRGKDPVLAFDSVAYSTVRSANGFGGGIGVLNVFNMKNASQPQQLASIAMTNPYGLGVKDSALYVCDGAAGLKMLNISRPFQPVSRGTFTITEQVYDVIVQGNMLVCYIQGGICLLDVSNRFNPVLITKLKN